VLEINTGKSSTVGKGTMNTNGTKYPGSHKNSSTKEHGESGPLGLMKTSVTYWDKNIPIPINEKKEDNINTIKHVIDYLNKDPDGHPH
jgi:hypothetical protein